MPRKKRLCPCEECSELPPRDLRTWEKHVTQIANGTRRRALPAQFGEEPPESTKGLWPGRKLVAPEDGAEEESDVEMSMEEMSSSASVLELVARGVLNVTGAEAILKTLSSTYNAKLPHNIQIPRSWHICRKNGVRSLSVQPLLFTRHFCPECDYLFEEDRRKVRCPSCRKDTRYREGGKPARVSYYRDLGNLVAMEFSSAYNGEMLRYGQRRAAAQDPSVGMRVVIVRMYILGVCFFI